MSRTFCIENKTFVTFIALFELCFNLFLFVSNLVKLITQSDYTSTIFLILVTFTCFIIYAGLFKENEYKKSFIFFWAYIILKVLLSIVAIAILVISIYILCDSEINNIDNIELYEFIIYTIAIVISILTIIYNIIFVKIVYSRMNDIKYEKNVRNIII